MQTVPPTKEPVPIITEDISIYMRDIEAYPRISVKRETELAYFIQHGTEQERRAAREELICSNLRLVVKIAHDFKRYKLGFADLVAEGNKGLLQAADRFDASKNVKFSCYAAWWIKQCMRKAIANDTRVIRVPSGSGQKLYKVQKASAEYYSANGIYPSKEELSAMTGMTIKTLDNLDAADIQMYSLDDMVKEDSHTTFGDMLANTIDDGAIKAAYVSHQMTLVFDSLKLLSDKERFIIERSFGIEGNVIPDEELCLEVGMPIAALQERRASILSMLKDRIEAAS